MTAADNDNDDAPQDASKPGEKDSEAAPGTATSTTAYCAELQRWMWRCYWGHASWQGGWTGTAFPFPFLPAHTPSTSPPHPGVFLLPPPPVGSGSGSSASAGQQTYDPNPHRYNYPYPYPFSYPAPPPYLAGVGAEQPAADNTPGPGRPPAQQQNQNGNAPQAGRGVSGAI